MKNNKHLWNKIWSKSKTSSSELRKSIQNELKSIRWKEIEKQVLNKWKSFKGLNVVELGSGRGIISLIMRSKGANITLIDYSEVALERSQLLFKEFNYDAKFVKANILNLPSEFLAKFDISMSFGLGEHFTGKERKQVFSSHFLALKENGLSFISVPNKLCLPYMIWKKVLELRHRWIYGIEDPFTRFELKKRGLFAGFKSCKVLGSSFLNDIDRFSLFNTLTRIGINTERATFLDNYLGYALILIGYNV